MRNAQTFSNSQNMLTASKVHSCLDTLPSQNDLSCRKENVQFCNGLLHLKTSYVFLDLLYCQFFPGASNGLPVYCTKAGGMCLPNLSQSCNKLKHMVAKHANKKRNTFPKCHPTTRAPQMQLRNRNPSVSSPPWAFSEPLWPKSRRGLPLHDHGAINTAQENPTKNSQPHHSLRTCVCAYPFFVADVTDLFDNDFNVRNSWYK